MRERTTECYHCGRWYKVMFKKCPNCKTINDEYKAPFVFDEKTTKSIQRERFDKGHADKDLVLKHWNILTKREQQIADLYYGITSGIPLTYSTAGRSIGLINVSGHLKNIKKKCEKQERTQQTNRDNKDTTREFVSPPVKEEEGSFGEEY